jgi:hypothetical protein
VATEGGRHVIPFDTRHVTFDEQVTIARAWLGRHARPGGRTWQGSYRLKHSAQGHSGLYVSSAAMVAAARVAGFQVRDEDRWGNADLLAVVITPRRRRAP